MKYMLLIYGDPALFAAAPPEEQGALFHEYGAFTKDIMDSGEYVSGDPLEGIETATTVRVRNGERTLTDGPFAETKEVLGGYYIVDVRDLDRALEIAALIPGARRGFDSIEVRPVMDVSAAMS